eukprot:CAMPEP_0198727488 /NCGR_PEP_ID=MMETSP1475-20131203/4270_1 /TAXON_ID= ORGANISM="Unidentified sp., Strain CCMP1999" /NCGR_SAMPLE_ID=MMETSP1475 /ASSEMBLY_ACC=CAM_ASM_001111 /LENGTH=89 /DNA_ID=CAMNT_0044489535 /DNA_START=63 /DNA_END=332 /DNA_ORIENTATION=+
MQARNEDTNKSKNLFSKSLPTSPFFSMLKIPTSPKLSSDSFSLSKANSLSDIPDMSLGESADAAKLHRTSSVDRTAQAMIDFKDVWLSP